MESGLLHTLQRYQWQFFGSLSFRSVKLPEAVRLKMWASLYRESASWCHVSEKKLIWFLRMEHGESTDRLHFHFLLGGHTGEYHLRERCFALMGCWQSFGGGIPRIRPYKPQGDGAAYLCKCLNVAGANLYEGRKFSKEGESVKIADACWRGVGLARSFYPVANGSVGQPAPTQLQMLECQSNISELYGGYSLEVQAPAPEAR